jgi:hypothetical protein
VEKLWISEICGGLKRKALTKSSNQVPHGDTMLVSNEPYFRFLLSRKQHNMSFNPQPFFREGSDPAPERKRVANGHGRLINDQQVQVVWRFTS